MFVEISGLGVFRWQWLDACPTHAREQAWKILCQGHKPGTLEAWSEAARLQTHFGGF